ncbi:MAG: transporter [Frankiales bacterium]|nr:transporter [Frankiales bacterium]
MPDTRPHPQRTLLVLTLPALAYSLAQTMLVPAFTDIVRELHSSAENVTWVLTSYLVAAAVFTPLVGRLGDMVGKRRMLVLSVGAFALGNLISALAGNIGWVIVGRVVQGIAGGMFPLVFGIIRDELPPEKVGSAIGFVSSTLGIGGGVGLLLGGAMVDTFGYTSIFWLGTLASVISVITIQLLVPESELREPGKLDLRGAAVLSVGLVLALFGVSKGRAWGFTDARTLSLIVGGLVVLVLWYLLQARTEDPLVDVVTLRHPPVLLTNLATLFVGVGMFGAYVLVPQLVEAPTSTGYGFGATATHAGLLMLPGSLSMLVFGPISGALGSKYGHRVSLAFGALVTAVGLGMLSAFHGSDTSIFAWFLLLSTGIAFAFAAMPNLIVASVPLNQTGQATGFNAVVRSVGSSVGTTITAVIVASSVTHGYATNHGYVIAFVLCAVVSLLAAVLAFFVPTSKTPHILVSEEIGAASLLPDPALAGHRS